MDTLSKLMEVVPAATYLSGWEITPKTKIGDLLQGSFLLQYFLTLEIKEKFEEYLEVENFLEKTILDLAAWLIRKKRRSLV